MWDIEQPVLRLVLGRAGLQLFTKKEKVCLDPLCPPKPGGGILLSSQDCRLQADHNEFKHSRHSSLGLLLACREVASQRIDPGSQRAVHGLGKQKTKNLADILKLKEVEIPPNSVFVGHSQLQHTWACRIRGYALVYLSLVILDGLCFRDAAASANDALLGHNSVLSGMDESEASSDVRDESNQHGTCNNSESNQGVLHWALARSWLRMSRLASGWNESVALKFQSMCVLPLRLVYWLQRLVGKNHWYTWWALTWQFI